MRFGLFLGVAVLMLVSLWALLRPLAEMPPGASASARVLADAPRRFVVDADAAPQILRLDVGDHVELSVLSAHDDELHLHGYDLALDLRAGEPGVLRFVAEHSGRFELELHKRDAQIAILEIQPR
ncbi:hypothetical protein [Sinimarinibacterium sp. NLF-5-8]|uniref:hypothetical protein n=1 Tax=Sinimarinibacterium sp. NLF-5-8 TaxID=2698684 RepID=UPI00137B98F8|nr:hypothetical protein [Sinimarinibacterium sp. NLF-5-8]QHS09700.1 hypothetical protein GT972_05695 [Sinimarinibacterium sp. NLF-5-8]